MSLVLAHCETAFDVPSVILSLLIFFYFQFLRTQQYIMKFFSVDFVLEVAEILL